MLSPPEVLGIYPVVLVGSALNPAVITSVVATPVAVTVTAVAQVAEEIAPVPSVAVPLATVTVQVGQEMAGVVPPLEAIGVVPVTAVNVPAAADESQLDPFQ